MKTILNIEVKLDINHKRKLSKRAINDIVKHKVGTCWWTDNNVYGQNITTRLISIEKQKSIRRVKLKIRKVLVTSKDRTIDEDKWGCRMDLNGNVYIYEKEKTNDMA